MGEIEDNYYEECPSFGNLSVVISIDKDIINTLDAEAQLLYNEDRIEVDDWDVINNFLRYIEGEYS